MNASPRATHAQATLAEAIRTMAARLFDGLGPNPIQLERLALSGSGQRTELRYRVVPRPA